MLGGMYSFYLKTKNQYLTCILFDSLTKKPEETVAKLFATLGISIDLVPIALTALERHSQNDMLYDPLKAKNLTQEDIKDADMIFKWLKLPFSMNVSMGDFRETMTVT